MSRRPLIAGNWKMHKTIEEAVSLVRELRENLRDVNDRDILVCPPFTAIKAVADELKNSNIKVGGQDVFWEDSGAYTGEISPDMLIDAGASYVIIGHSERRKYFGETNETVNRKVRKALEKGLTPIMCVGETLEEREAGKAFDVVTDHVLGGLEALSSEEVRKVVIAYEPVWAIGTGRTATPQDADAMHAHIRKLLDEKWGVGQEVIILYGGSVKPENIDSLMAMENIDGALVGGASLEADSFTRIVKFKV